MDAILPPLPQEREFKENRPRGNLKTNRGFGDFKGFDSDPGSVPPENGGFPAKLRFPVLKKLEAWAESLEESLPGGISRAGGTLAPPVKFALICGNLRDPREKF